LTAGKQLADLYCYNYLLICEHNALAYSGSFG